MWNGRTRGELLLHTTNTISDHFAVRRKQVSADTDSWFRIFSGIISPGLCSYSAPPPESPIGDRSVVMTVTLRRCHVSLCKHISRTTRVRSSPIFCLLHTAVAPSRSGGVAIRYVLPVLRMTSYLYITARNKRRNSDSIGHEFVTVSYTLTDPPGAALDRVRSLNLRLPCFPNGSFTPDVLRCAALHCGAAWHLSDVNEP